MISLAQTTHPAKPTPLAQPQTSETDKGPSAEAWPILHSDTHMDTSEPQLPRLSKRYSAELRRMEKRSEERTCCMFKLCLFISMAFGHTHWATKLADGFEMEVDEDTAIIEGELTIFITITKPEFPADLLQDIMKTMAIIRQMAPSMGTAIALSRLNIAKGSITIPI